MLSENDKPEGLPVGRITNRDAAEYVAAEVEAQQSTLRNWIAAYIDSRLESVRDGEKRFRIEMRAWLAGAVMLNALHPAGVAVSALGALGSVVGVHALARFFNR